VPTPGELREIALQHGQKKKRNNAMAAVLSGVVPGVVLTFYCPTTWERWLVGLMIGVLWGNAFEYSYHRWMLHRPESPFSKGHREHHAQLGAIAEAEHVTLGSSPLNVAILFLINGMFVIPVDFLLRLWITPGIFIGWSVYLIVAEEIHWRIHMNGWLPLGLRFARAYHLNHHHFPKGHYNVFLPLFDVVCGNMGSGGIKFPLEHRPIYLDDKGTQFADSAGTLTVLHAFTGGNEGGQYPQKADKEA
jgi:hypothetical protein